MSNKTSTRVRRKKKVRINKRRGWELAIEQVGALIIIGAFLVTFIVYSVHPF